MFSINIVGKERWKNNAKFQSFYRVTRVIVSVRVCECACVFTVFAESCYNENCWHSNHRNKYTSQTANKYDVCSFSFFLWCSRFCNFRLLSDSAHSFCTHLPYAGNACHITKGTQIELASILCGVLLIQYTETWVHTSRTLTHSLTHLHKIYSVCLQQDWCGFNGISSERGMLHPKKTHTHTQNFAAAKEWSP